MVHGRSRLVAGVVAVLAATAGSVAVASEASAATTAVSVNWAAAPVATANAASYGVNAWRGFAPSYAGYPGNATYKAGMDYMNIRFLRYHNYGMLGDSRTDPNGWLVDPDGDCTWDRRKIGRALYKSYPGHTPRMMNIPKWPGCMDATATDKLSAHVPIRASAAQQFANWAADLVRAVNVDHRRNVKYWELFNENDGCNQAQSGVTTADMTALAGLYRTTATAMKAVDPTIVVGGSGACNAYQTDLVRAFAAGAGDQLGFFSYHAYIGEYDDVNETEAVKQAHTASMYDQTANLNSLAALVRSTVTQATGRTVPLFHDEWSFGGPSDNSFRKNNGVGAVFAAMSLKQLVLAGVGSNFFCDADGRNGLLDAALVKRPWAHVFKLYNSVMFGDVVPATSSVPANVDAFAVKGSSLSLALANRAQAASPVRVSFAGVPESVRTVTVNTVTATGLTTSTTTVAALTAGDVTLPRDSVTVLTLS